MISEEEKRSSRNWSIWEKKTKKLPSFLLLLSVPPISLELKEEEIISLFLIDLLPKDMQ